MNQALDEHISELFDLNRRIMMIVWSNQMRTQASYVSENVQTLLGINAQSFRNGEVEYLQLVHPNDVVDIEQRLAQAEFSKTNHIHIEEYRLLTSEGEVRWVEETCVVERDEFNNIVRWGSLITDVTQRHKMQASADYHSARLELVLKGTRLGMWDWNPQTNEVAFDSRWAEMLGLTLDDLSMTLQDWESRVHPDDLADCYRDIQAHVDGEVPFYENIHRMKHRDGHWVYILDRGQVVARDKQGNPIRFTGTHTDITPQKEAELLAKNALDSRDKFFSAMSHEIRTPLHGILGIAQLMQQHPHDESQKQHLDTIVNSGTHLLTILNDILDVSKIDSGLMQLDVTPFSIDTLFEHVHHLFDAKAKQKQLAFEVKPVAKSTSVLSSDWTRMVQILSNLVSNAIKYTDMGNVTLSAQMMSNQMRIRVQDTGKGMTSTEHIFEPYWQDNLRSKKNLDSGTGLGLFITKKLCDLLQIHIVVNSKQGQGTTFDLLFEAEAISDDLSLAVPTLPSARPQMDDTSLSNLVVLIVDDNELNRLIAIDMIKGQVKQVLIARNSEEAIRLLQSEPIDLVLMDLHMPDVNGIETTKSIRADTRIAKQPWIIAVTADAFNVTRKKCLEAGMNDFLAKPFSRRQLHEKLKAVELECN